MSAPSGTPWTVETVLTHLTDVGDERDRRYEQRFVAQALATDAALAAAERAVLKAEAAAEKRFEGVNEFRATLSDQQRTLIPRAEVEVMLRGINDKISALEKTQDADRAQRDADRAERMGVKGGWGYAVGLAGVLIAILGVLSRLVRP
jgi:hypothetical protein